jgi:hypothetical protein
MVATNRSNRSPHFKHQLALQMARFTDAMRSAVLATGGSALC